MNCSTTGETQSCAHERCERCGSSTEQAVAVSDPAQPDGPDPTQRPQLLHDINHLLGLIVQLVAVVGLDEDLGPDSRARIGQITSQLRWLERLLDASHDASHDASGGGSTAAPRPEGHRGELAWAEAVRAYPVRVDSLARTVAQALDLAASTRMSFDAEESWACVDPLSLWRAIRNLMDNAVRAAGPGGQVDVEVESDAKWTLVRVDDDGPGFGFRPSGRPHLGLTMVREFVAQTGGRLEIGTSPLGGARVRMLVPAAPMVGPPSEPPSGSDGYR
jgi:signal transduction histidine kinase